mgnify:FL=1
MTDTEEYINTPDDVNWSINSYPDGNVNDYTSNDPRWYNWVDENSVGYAQIKGKEIIPQLKDGIYKVKQPNYNTGRNLLLKSEVLVWQGKIDIMSCKVAVAEFMNRTGDWHYFIESVSRVKNNKNSICFRLGS